MDSHLCAPPQKPSTNGLKVPDNVSASTFVHLGEKKRSYGFKYPQEVRAAMKVLSANSTTTLADIVLQTGLSMTAVSTMLATLVTQNLVVVESEDGEGADRRPSCFRLNPHGAFSIGILIDNALIHIAVMNLARDVCHSVSCLRAGKTPDDVIDVVIDELKIVALKKVINLSRLEGIGLSFCPPAASGKPDLEDCLIKDLQRALSFKFRVPIVLEDQIVATALGKALSEQNAGIDSFIYVLLDADVSCALVTGKHLQRVWALGELPLIDVFDSTLSDGGTSLSAWFADLFLLTDVGTGGVLTPNDQMARLRQVANYLFMPLVTLISMLRPTVVYIGGTETDVLAGVCQHLNRLSETLNPAQVSWAQFEPACGDNDALAAGTAALPFIRGVFQPLDAA